MLPKKGKAIRARRRPSTYHHGDLARALLDVSMALIDRGGPESFSVRDAASRCGVAVSAVYKHFPSKEALLLAVADRGFEALADRGLECVSAVAGGGTALERAEARLVATGRAYILFAAERPELFRLLFGPLGPRGGRADPRPDAPSHRVGALLGDALREVMEARGHSLSRLPIHKLISWAIVHGFAMMLVDGVWPEASRERLEAIISELGQAVLRSLR